MVLAMDMGSPFTYFVVLKPHPDTERSLVPGKTQKMPDMGNSFNCNHNFEVAKGKGILVKDKVVVSLSTIPPRFSHIGETLKYLLDQKLLPDEIQLYIPKNYRRFPQHSFTIPEIPKGGRVVVKIVEEDLGPATKVLYCAKSHWGTPTRIIYCDDDRLLERDWLQKLILATNQNPNDAIAAWGKNLPIDIKNRRKPKGRIKKYSFGYNIGYVARKVCHKSKELIFRRPFSRPNKRRRFYPGYVDIAEGFGGVSIKPDFFDLDAFDIPPIVWSVDDIWLSGMLEKANIGIRVGGSLPMPFRSAASPIEALYDFSTDGFDSASANDFAVKHLQDRYGIWN